jgi:hypothetical protein
MWLRIIWAFVAMDLAIIAVGALGGGIIGVTMGDPDYLSQFLVMALISIYISLPLTLGATLLYWVPLAIILACRAIKSRRTYALVGAIPSLVFTGLYILGNPDAFVNPMTGEPETGLIIMMASILCAGPIGGLVYRRVYLWARRSTLEPHVNGEV